MRLAWVCNWCYLARFAAAKIGWRELNSGRRVRRTSAAEERRTELAARRLAANGLGEDAMAKKQWSSTAPPGEFHPYIPAEESIAEFTLRAVVLGALFGLLFGAVTVYVGLRAGLTVSASIPIAVLSISILRAFGRSTILENNIVQTTGSAGESVAAGVIFTIPALIFLGFGAEFTFWRIFPLALLGGWLGVLFMVPLRRQLIVKEQGERENSPEGEFGAKAE